MSPYYMGSYVDFYHSSGDQLVPAGLGLSQSSTEGPISWKDPHWSPKILVCTFLNDTNIGLFPPSLHLLHFLSCVEFTGTSAPP